MNTSIFTTQYSTDHSTIVATNSAAFKTTVVYTNNSTKLTTISATNILPYILPNSPTVYSAYCSAISATFIATNGTAK